MDIRISARDDRPSAGITVTARLFSSIDTTQQSQLDFIKWWTIATKWWY